MRPRSRLPQGYKARSTWAGSSSVGRQAGFSRPDEEVVKLAKLAGHLMLARSLLDAGDPSPASGGGDRAFAGRDPELKASAISCWPTSITVRRHRPHEEERSGKRMPSNQGVNHEDTDPGPLGAGRPLGHDLPGRTVLASTGSTTSWARSSIPRKIPSKGWRSPSATPYPAAAIDEDEEEREFKFVGLPRRLQGRLPGGFAVRRTSGSSSAQQDGR
jgi:hypothetical protein